MTIKSGLFTGLNTGLKTSTLTKYGGVSLLYDLDFSDGPTAQTFPATAAGLASALGDANATPRYIWLCDEASGNLVDEIASEPLVPTNSPLQGQTATGLPGSPNCVETKNGTTMAFISDDNTVMDVNAADFAFICVLRASRKQTVNDAIFGKQQTSSSAGWSLNLQSSSGWKFRLHDGTNSLQLTHSAVLDDGAWHVIMGRYDHSAQMMYCYADNGTATSLSTAASAGNFSNTRFFQLGDTESNTSPALQFKYFAFFEGATACDPLDQTALDSFWVHGSDPTGKLSTASRASAISYWSASGEIAHHASGAVPVVYEPALASGAGGYGLLCNKATTNLITYSESLATAGWVNNAAESTDSDGAGDSPDGCRNAPEMTSSANNAFMYVGTNIPVSTSTAYTFSVWVKRNQGTDVAGKIRLQDIAAGTGSNQTFTATATWQRISVTVTSDAAATTMQPRLYIDTSGDSCFFWGMQLEAGTAASHYVRTEGASAASVAGDYGLSDWAQSETGQGEIVTTMVRHNHVASDAQSYVFKAKPTVGGLHNRRILFSDTATRTRFYPYSSGGVLEDTSAFMNSLSDGTEFVFRTIWDDSAAGDITGGYESVMVHNGTTVTGGASPCEYDFTGGNTADLLSVGSQDNTGQYLNGVIQSIKSYDGLSEAIP